MLELELTFNMGPLIMLKLHGPSYNAKTAWALL